MKIISFSVWGNDPFYVKGIKENIELAQIYYPGWTCKIYYDSSFDINQIPEELKQKAIFEYVPITRGTWDGLFWRFAPASDPNVEIFVVRDLDSRLNSREAAAVQEWVNSPYEFHCMRDHIQHNVEIMGGMWGCKNPYLIGMIELIKTWNNFDSKGTDQNFLSKMIWPLIKKNCIVHDRYPKGIFLSPDQRYFLFEEIKEYNPFDNCGDEKDTNFPRGKIVLNDGTTYRREEVYEYFPQKYFGPHNIKEFPPHEPIKYGQCVGDYVR